MPAFVIVMLTTWLSARTSIGFQPYRVNLCPAEGEIVFKRLLIELIS